MKKFFQIIIGILSQSLFALKEVGKRWRIALLLAIGGALLLFVAYGLHQSMQSHPPKVSIDQQLMRERLFINVCEDSLEQLATSRGLYYDGPGFFSRRAAISLPSDDQPLLAELDSLQYHYPDQLEIDNGRLLCPAQKVNSTRYITLPVVLLIRMNFMPLSKTSNE